MEMKKREREREKRGSRAHARNNNETAHKTTINNSIIMNVPQFVYRQIGLFLSLFRFLFHFPSFFIFALNTFKSRYIEVDLWEFDV